MIIIGIDPDSKAHGVAEYHDGVLVSLASLDLMSIYLNLENTLIDIEAKGRVEQIEIHIEDVNEVSAAFNARDKKTNINIKLQMAQHIGKCKQAQIEVERLCEFLGIKVVKHKIAKNWKDAVAGKRQFEAVTGWAKRSNEDTRSAAYFGFLGHKNGITKINKAD